LLNSLQSLRGYRVGIGKGMVFSPTCTSDVRFGILTEKLEARKWVTSRNRQSLDRYDMTKEEKKGRSREAALTCLGTVLLSN
jgi:hypothetical protein